MSLSLTPVPPESDALGGPYTNYKLRINGKVAGVQSKVGNIEQALSVDFNTMTATGGDTFSAAPAIKTIDEVSAGYNVSLVSGPNSVRYVTFDAGGDLLFEDSTNISALVGAGKILMPLGVQEIIEDTYVMYVAYYGNSSVDSGLAAVTFGVPAIIYPPYLYPGRDYYVVPSNNQQTYCFTLAGEKLLIVATTTGYRSLSAGYSPTTKFMFTFRDVETEFEALVGAYPESLGAVGLHYDPINANTLILFWHCKPNSVPKIGYTRLTYSGGSWTREAAKLITGFNYDGIFAYTDVSLAMNSVGQIVMKSGANKIAILEPSGADFNLVQEISLVPVEPTLVQFYGVSDLTENRVVLYMRLNEAYDVYKKYTINNLDSTPPTPDPTEPLTIMWLSSIDSKE